MDVTIKINESDFSNDIKELLAVISPEEKKEIATKVFVEIASQQSLDVIKHALSGLKSYHDSDRTMYRDLINNALTQAIINDKEFKDIVSLVVDTTTPHIGEIAVNALTMMMVSSFKQSVDSIIFHHPAYSMAVDVNNKVMQMKNNL